MVGPQRVPAAQHRSLQSRAVRQPPAPRGVPGLQKCLRGFWHCFAFPIEAPGKGRGEEVEGEPSSLPGRGARRRGGAGVGEPEHGDAVPRGTALV